MVQLLQLSNEVILNILGHVDPDDLARISKTCRFLNHLVKGYRPLCRDIYLRVLDTPPSNDLDWEEELHDLVRLQRICASSDPAKPRELPFVYNTVTRLVRHAATSNHRTTRAVTYPPSRNTRLLAELFKHESNLDAFLSRSFLFERARGIAGRFGDRPREEHQQSAKLHCLYGMPNAGSASGRMRSRSMYPFACSKVYDLREYTEETGWGPFMKDGSGRVDWEKVEAILLVLRENIRKKGLDGFPVFANYWNTPFAGTWSGSYARWPAHRERMELEKQDPYDVSGTWMRVVCFLDYNDFFSYNFPLNDEPPDDVPRRALDTGEAVRFIVVKIHVTKIEHPGPDEDPRYPIVHFKGISRSVDGSWEENANSDLRGTARTTREGEVRWTTYSIFNGEEKWKSEGIQLGGIRSARGVVGNWFDKDYDPRGPCGPTAFWKVADRNPNSNDEKILGQDFLPIVGGHIDDLGDPSQPTVAAAIQDDTAPFQFQFIDSEDPIEVYDAQPSIFHILTHIYGHFGGVDESGSEATDNPDDVEDDHDDEDDDPDDEDWHEDSNARDDD